MSCPVMVTAVSSQLQHWPERAPHHDSKLQPGRGDPRSLAHMRLRKSGSCQGQEAYEKVCEEMYFGNRRRNRRNVWKGTGDGTAGDALLEEGDSCQHMGIPQALKLWAVHNTPQVLQPMEEAQSKGNWLSSKKQQMENITHTAPTSCTSHHLTKGVGRDECITQQKRGKSKLGSGEKRYLTEMETVLLLMEARLFTSLTGKEKKVPFSLHYFYFCLFPKLFSANKDPARAKTKLHFYQGIPSEILAKVTHFGQGI